MTLSNSPECWKASRKDASPRSCCTSARNSVLLCNTPLLRNSRIICDKELFLNKDTFRWSSSLKNCWSSSLLLVAMMAAATVITIIKWHLSVRLPFEHYASGSTLLDRSVGAILTFQVYKATELVILQRKNLVPKLSEWSYTSYAIALLALCYAAL